MSVTDIIQRLDAKRSGEGWKAKCPAHDDRVPSLSIKEGSDGRVLLHCHAGCSIDDILRALGLTLRDLFPAGSSLNGARRERPENEAPEKAEPPRETVTPRPLGELLDAVVGFLRNGWCFNTRSKR
jgi:putative DNA primase/helicase